MKNELWIKEQNVAISLSLSRVCVCLNSRPVDFLLKHLREQLISFGSPRRRFNNTWLPQVENSQLTPSL